MMREMVFLTHLTLRGYKSIADLEHLPLGDLNVLIGSNGSGKSNLLSFFELLQAIVDGRLTQFVGAAGGASRLLHHGAKRTPGLSFDLQFGEVEGKSNGYKLELTSNAVDGLAPSGEEVRFWDRVRYPERPFATTLTPTPTEAGIRDPYLKGAGWWVHRELLLLRRYHFHDTGPASPLRSSCSVHDNISLRGDGANLAAYLLLLKTRFQAEYAVLLAHLRRVAPFIRELVLEPLALSPELTRIRWSHVANDALFDVSALSDGTLRFLALLAVLLQPDNLSVTRPQLVIIDEPELGLHPFAVHLLGALLRSASHDRQLLVATQSALLLDEFEPEDVIVTELAGDASTYRRLSSEQLGEWLEDFSLGELWEKNELGGRPS